jgi:hypothetical protein
MCQLRVGCVHGTVKYDIESGIVIRGNLQLRVVQC